MFGGLAGLTQAVLGSPGDLPDTIKCIHERGAIPIKQAPSMFICSAFSIVAGIENVHLPALYTTLDARGLEGTERIKLGSLLCP